MLYHTHTRLLPCETRRWRDPSSDSFLSAILAGVEAFDVRLDGIKLKDLDKDSPLLPLPPIPPPNEGDVDAGASKLFRSGELNFVYSTASFKVDGMKTPPDFIEMVSAVRAYIDQFPELNAYPDGGLFLEWEQLVL